MFGLGIINLDHITIFLQWLGEEWMAQEARSDGIKLISSRDIKREAPISIGCIFNIGSIDTRCLLNWWAQLKKINVIVLYLTLYFFNQE